MSSTTRSSAGMNGDKPPCRKMMKQFPQTSILSLPYDLLLNCLARVSRSYHPTLSLVSKKFRSVVASPELYQTRSLLHCTESFIYLCLRYHYPRGPNTHWFALCRKPNRTITDGSSGNCFIPIPIGLDADLVCAGSLFSGVIGDVMFLWIDGDFMWYDSKARSWKPLYGDRVLPDIGGHCKMVDFGGNMAIFWESYRDNCDGHVEEIFIWCAEIALERRDDDELWGLVEWCDVVLTSHGPCSFNADFLSATV